MCDFAAGECTDQSRGAGSSLFKLFSRGYRTLCTEPWRFDTARVRLMDGGFVIIYLHRDFKGLFPSDPSGLYIRSSELRKSLKHEARPVSLPSLYTMLVPVRPQEYVLISRQNGF